MAYVKGLAHAWHRASTPKALTGVTLTTLPSSSTHHSHPRQEQLHGWSPLTSQGFPSCPSPVRLDHLCV